MIKAERINRECVCVGTGYRNGKPCELCMNERLLTLAAKVVEFFGHCRCEQQFGKCLYCEAKALTQKAKGGQ